MHYGVSRAREKDLEMAASVLQHTSLSLVESFQSVHTLNIKHNKGGGGGADMEMPFLL